MKTLFTAAIAMLSGLAVVLTVCAGSARAQQTDTSAIKKSETPFFCNLKGLTAEQRRRQVEIAIALRDSLQSIRELADGFEFEFSSDPALYQALTEFTPMEHACCPFFDISIRLERETGKLSWRLTGREGVKTFIKSEFSRWFKH